MRTMHHQSEKGQAVIFLILGLTIFMGFLALAIDGGMVYADRRNAQNVADSAALAGAAAASLYLEDHQIYYNSWDCDSWGIYHAKVAGLDAAINRAAANNMAIDADNTDLNGVLVTCGQQFNGTYTERFIDITVDISQATTTTFAHLLMSDESLSNHVVAVTRIHPRMPMAFGNAIVALNPAGCSGNSNGIVIHGNATVYVDGGGAFSNGCLQGNGQPVMDVTNGTIAYIEDFNPGNADWEPAPIQATAPIPAEQYALPEPDCTGRWVSSLDGTLDPGLYCISGDLKINANKTVVGHGVTIYIPNGKVQINGNATLQLTAPVANPDPSPAIPGVLFYMPPSNSNTMKINGTSDSYLQGSIIAPGADIEILGTGAVNGYRTQVIGWNVRVGGTADTFVLFNANDQYSKPTTMELFR
ncbi:MAG TPA: Tad domain-containing protein [Anaerolineales bacterium]|nr:Tad domain-containing protein [Anaerolineales bacterium]